MKERPILFSAPMVRALLAGTKTQTRRIVKPQPYLDVMGNACHDGYCYGQNASGRPLFESLCSPLSCSRTGRPLCPYGRPGNRLWVREAFQRAGGNSGWWYRATDEAADYGRPPVSRWRPSIHMSRVASRITLEITGIRVERLQDISEADALAEGVDAGAVASFARTARVTRPAGHAYRDLWESINGAGSWDLNPWIWVVEFKRVEGGAA